MASKAASKVVDIKADSAAALKQEQEIRKAKAAAGDKPKPETDAEKIARLEDELATERKNVAVLVGAIDQSKADMAKIAVWLDKKLGR